MDQPVSSPSAILTDTQLRELCERAPAALAFVDVHGFLRYANRGFRDLLVPDTASVTGWHVQDLFDSVDAVRWGQMIESSLKRDHRTRERTRLADAVCGAVDLCLRQIEVGTDAWIAVSATRVTDDGDLRGLNQLQRDVLEAVAGGESIPAIMDLLCRRVEALAPGVLCTVLSVDSEGRVHPCAAPSLPASFSEAIDGAPIGPQAGSCGTAAWRGEAVEVTDIAHDPLWDDYRALALPLGLAACWSTPIKSRDGRVIATFALYRRETGSISSFHQDTVAACTHLCSLALKHDEAERRIHELAFFDALTHLANPTLLRDRAEQALVRAETQHRGVAVMFIDVDRFKTVNDSMGHRAGDRLLVEIARRLQATVKPGDTVARPGGDEFVLVLCDIDRPGALHVAERILNSIAEPVVIDGSEVAVSMSVGISLFPDDGRVFDVLLRNAEAAMYRAKAESHCSYRLFKAQMDEADIQRFELESALRKAVAEDALVVAFQPQVDLATNRLLGFEALARWQDPERGAISPEVFIPIAEECGLIAAIDRFVLDFACAHLRRWRDAGLGNCDVSVNVSASELAQDDVVRRVQSTLQRHGLPPSAVTLEITEGLLLHSIPETLAHLEQLRAMGVRVALDDFGTGYSGLSYLKRFPVDELKVDRSFVRDLAHDAGDRALTVAILQIARNFGLRVVAEGVETESQRAFLQSNGCTAVQGYLVSRALLPDELSSWLVREGRRFID